MALNIKNAGAEELARLLAKKTGRSITDAVIYSLREQEAEARNFALAIRNDPVRLLSAVSALEVAVVMEARKGPSGGRAFDLLLHLAKAEVIPFTPEQLEVAREACRNYGKGAGSDFPKTDIAMVSQSSAG